jgi:transcriptional regulator with XRE-family HTH domain
VNRVQAEIATRMGITQGRVSAIEHAKPGTTELRTLATYVEPSPATWRSPPTSATGSGYTVSIRMLTGMRSKTW